jgi:predicted DNA-binding antitoxin AbrB/MazE fold protein
MATTVLAVYENGRFRPIHGVKLEEGQRVRLTVETDLSPVERSAGLVPWSGTPEELERFAIDPEFGILGSTAPEEGP